MNIWILIILLLGETNYSGQAVSSVEFSSEEHCVAAKKVLEKMERSWRRLPRDTPGIVVAYCFPK